VTVGHRNEFLRLLKLHSVKVAEPGQEFTLASGAKSRFYIDVKQAAMRGNGLHHLGYLFYQAILEGGFGGPVSVFAGVALGGCHLATLAAMYSIYRGGIVEHDGPQYDVVYIRKEAKDHGTKSLVEGPKRSTPGNVVLFEDVVTTGGSSLKAVQQLKEAGYTVGGILAVIDRRAKEDRTPQLEDVPLKALYTLDDFDTVYFDTV
jgi:orotate phosphoribosyltransferase